MPSTDLTDATDLRDALRTEVGRLREREVRRIFPASIHLGIPAGPQVGIEVPWPLPSSYDAGLLLDVLDALADRWRVAVDPGQQDLGLDWSLGWWLVRPGQPSVHDADVRLLGAARRATAAHGLTSTKFWAITRYGWLDVGTGQHREWKRLRLHRSDRP